MGKRLTETGHEASLLERLCCSAIWTGLPNYQEAGKSSDVVGVFTLLRFLDVRFSNWCHPGSGSQPAADAIGWERPAAIAVVQS